MIIRYHYTLPTSHGGRRVTRDFTVPDGSTDISADLIGGVPISRPAPSVDRSFIRVRFPGSSTEYCYRCVDGAVVGDRVAVPPTPMRPRVQIVRVVGIGRGDTSYTGPLKTAVLIPDDDDGCS